MGIRMSPSSAQVTAASLQVLTSVTRMLSSSVQTPENRAQLEKWVTMIWEDCGRHLRDIELKLMAVVVDILAAVAEGGDYPAHQVTSRSMPVLLEAVQGAETGSSAKRTSLKMMSKLLASTAASSVTKKDWYDDFVHACNSELHTEEGCMALASGLHFLRQQNATDILDHLFQRCFEAKQELEPQLAGLITKLCRKLSRPNQDEVDKLLDLADCESRLSKPLLSVFKVVCCYDKELLSSKVLPRMSSMKKPRPQMLNVAWTTHQCLDHFMAPTSDIFDTVAAHLDGDEEGVQLLASISSRLGESHVQQVSRILEGTAGEVILTHASRDLIRALEKAGRDWRPLFNEASSARVQGSIMNKTSNPEELSRSVLDKVQSEQILWCLRGLALRSFSNLGPWIDLILADEALSDQMGFIVSPPAQNESMDVNKAGFRLTRQKIFALTKNRLIEAYTQTGRGLKPLVAQLPHIPKFLLASEMAQLLPLLKNCLSCQAPIDGDLMVSALACIKDVVAGEGGAEVKAGMVASLLPLWLEVATCPEAPMKARIAGLECVKAAKKAVPASDIVVHKKETLQSLTQACDDKKRLVRLAAVNAKNTWCMETAA